MKIIMKILCISFVFILLYPVFMSVSANEAYKTYTYSYNGDELVSPDAYVYSHAYSGDELGIGKLSQPDGMCADNKENVYIADTKNNRVICLDKNFKVKYNISSFKNDSGANGDLFNNPDGVYATDSGSLYVADTENERIVEFNAEDGKLMRVIPRPVSKLLDGYVYKPNSIAVDAAGRIYVVSKSVNVGVVVLEADGSFSGFLGAKKVTPDVSDLIWRYFMTKQQKENSVKLIPSSYNNLAIDDIGFIYVTTSSYKDWEIQGYLYFRMQTDQFAPIRRINTLGYDVLNRKGFYPPAGDVNFKLTNNPVDGASQIVDVALYKNGIYSLLDQKRSKVFTYDIDGNLLYAFGGMGTQDGLAGRSTAIAYKGSDILQLDAENGKIIDYKITAYGNTLISAIELNNQRNYEQSIEKWKNVLKLNNNMEIAYSAMGQIYMTQEKYTSALDCFKLSSEVNYYSKAYGEIRKQYIRAYAIPIVIIFILLIILLLKFFKYTKRINLEGQSIQVKKTLYRQLIYAFHIIFKPFDGFYDMKHEKRASVKSATIILIATICSFIFKKIFTGYIFGGRNAGFDLMGSIMLVLLPFLLWCIANWCLTTLMDGEGKFRDIYMATVYGLVPMILINIPVTILSNFMTLEEGTMLTFATTVFYGWSFLLILAGIMTIHNYTFLKNMATTLCTVIGMGIIMFISLLFLNVIQKFIAFGVNIYNEIAFRL